MNKIILIRHAKTDYSLQGLLTAKEAQYYLNQFNKAGILIRKNDKQTVAYLKSLITSDYLIFVSQLTRSDKTANLFIKSDLYTQNAIFNEFGLNILQIPFIKLPFQVWMLISRIAWFLGCDLATENYREALNRANLAAQFLIAQARKTNKPVILFGHGLINQKIGQELIKNGWRLKNSYGDNDHLSYKIYENLN